MTLTAKLDYFYVTKQLFYQQGLLAILALTMSGTLVYSNGIFELLMFFYAFFIDPSTQLFFASQLGFVWDRVQLKNH